MLTRLIFLTQWQPWLHRGCALAQRGTFFLLIAAAALRHGGTLESCHSASASSRCPPSVDCKAPFGRHTFGHFGAYLCFKISTKRAHILPGFYAACYHKPFLRLFSAHANADDVTKQRVINTRKRKLAKKAKKPLSSNKSVRQRFRITANGHVKYKRAGMRHFLRNKRPKVKRKLRKGGIFTGGGRRAKQWHKLAKRVAYAYEEY